jgi:uncharacterized protein YjdB
VTTIPKTPPAPVVTVVTIAPAAANVRWGDSLQLVPTVTLDGVPSAATLAYSSSDAGVVSVSASGMVRALKLGATTLTATHPSGKSASTVITVITGMPASIDRVAGNSQSATVGTAVPVRPSVRVFDGGGNPVVGVTVTFSGDGTLKDPIAITDSLGIATLGGWTLSTLPGANYLSAAASTLPPLGFTAMGTAVIVITADLSHMRIATQPVAGVPGKMAIQPVIQLIGTDGDLYKGANRLVTASLSLPGLSGTTTVMSSSGIATFSDLQISGVGSYTISFSSPSVPSVTSEVFMVTPVVRNTAVTVSTSPNPSPPAATVAVTGRVTTVAGHVPTGTLQFMVGGVNLGGPVNLIGGQASISGMFTPGGTHAVTAFYSGDNYYQFATSPAASHVAQPLFVPTITVSSDINPSRVGDAVTLTFAVNVSLPVLNLYVYRDGVLVGLGHQENTSTATTTVFSYRETGFTAGTHRITGVTDVGPTNASGTSAPYTQVTNP